MQIHNNKIGRLFVPIQVTAPGEVVMRIRVDQTDRYKVNQHYIIAKSLAKVENNFHTCTTSLLISLANHQYFYGNMKPGCQAVRTGSSATIKAIGGFAGPILRNHLWREIQATEVNKK